jgi:hypothetical protein
MKVVQECRRVARKSIFLTTSNRWFPMEFDTVLPLVHWLPISVFGGLMRISGRSFFAEESNLNLMDARDLRSIALQIEDFTFSVSSVSPGCWPSNLLLRRVKARNPQEVPPTVYCQSCKPSPQVATGWGFALERWLR